MEQIKLDNFFLAKKHIVILAKKCFNLKSIYDLILSRQKTIESRWSMNKIAPYEKVKVGDILLLKEMGQPVTATAVVEKAEFFKLTPEIVNELRIKFGKQIGTDKEEDWKSTLNKKYGSLIWLKDVKEITPMQVKRSNGSGWIMLK